MKWCGPSTRWNLGRIEAELKNNWFVDGLSQKESNSAKIGKTRFPRDSWDSKRNKPLHLSPPLYVAYLSARSERVDDPCRSYSRFSWCLVFLPSTRETHISIKKKKKKKNLPPYSPRCLCITVALCLRHIVKEKIEGLSSTRKRKKTCQSFPTGFFFFFFFFMSMCVHTYVYS